MGRREHWDDDWLDAAFALLADGRRRFVLAYMRYYREATLLVLANAVTGWQRTRTGGGVASRADRDRVAARLHHADLPELAAAGVVYDSRSRHVELVELPPPMDDLLAVATGDRRVRGRNRERSADHRRCR